jgi:hypothetical protein
MSHKAQQAAAAAPKAPTQSEVLRSLPAADLQHSARATRAIANHEGEGACKPPVPLLLHA